MASESIPIRSYARRSSRIARRLNVTLRWRDPEGNWKEAPAETLQLSQYGCLVACPTSFKPGDDLFLRWPEEQREAQARTVFRLQGAGREFVKLAFEFPHTENFWGIEFPPDLT